MIKNLNKVFYIIGDKKLKFFVLSLGSLLSSIFDIIGIGMVGPLVISFLDIDLLYNFVTQYTNIDISILEKYNHLNIIIFFCIILLISFTLKSLISFLITREIMKVGFLIQKDLRNKFIKIFQDLTYEEFLKKKTSELLHAINHLTIVFCQSTIVKLFVLFSELIILFSVIFFLFIINIKITFLIFFTLTLIYIFYFFFIRKKMTLYGTILGEADQKFLDYGKITMDGFKEIRILQKDRYFFDEYKKINKIFADVHLKYDTNLILPKFLLESSIIVVIMILTISIVIFSGNTSNSIALIGIFTVSAARIIPVVYNIFNSVGTILGSMYSIDKIYEFVIQNEQKNKFKNKIKINLNEIKNFEKLEFKNVNFGYDKINIINNINLTINKGEIIGISGDSGSGKTTLINLLIGFLSPNDGEILVNEFDIHNNLINWQSKISYISQQNFVYGASILENVTLEKQNDKIDFEKFQKSLDAAHLLKFVNNLKDKEKTIISDQVLNISGGQKQRIALARSFYFNRNFIILDESLNALQESLQEKILTELKRNENDLTIILVSHNKKNLEHCDYIFELNNGILIKK